VRRRPFPPEGSLEYKILQSGSYWEPWEIGRVWEWTLKHLVFFIVRTERGIITFTIAQTSSQPMPGSRFDHRRLEFAWRRYSSAHGMHEHDNVSIIDSYWHAHEVTLPFWALFLLTATPTGILLAQAWRTACWLRSGRCIRCGYDLTGNTSGICPECGTRVIA
jgi:hypothetical protein